MADKIGCARSKASLLPPHINVSVPAVAAATPPDTGASIMLKPFSFAAVATALTDATSMVVESIKVADVLKTKGISVEVLDLRSIRPLDKETILNSVKKTHRLLVVDNGWTFCGVSAEIISVVTENIFDELGSAPQRVGLNDSPSPSTRALASGFYPTTKSIAKKVCEILNYKVDLDGLFPNCNSSEDVPSPHYFSGPF